MGGVIRRASRFIRRLPKKIIGETAKAAGLVPTNKQIAGEQMKADAAAAKAAAEAKAAQERAAAEAEAKRKQDAAFKAQQGVDVVDANNPDDAEYSEGKTKKKRKKTKTILTGTKGVIGDAPTESKTLLGG
jgi:membrane protein involved in colicin uptake